MFADFYRKRRVLITGASGFKGGWLSFWARELGADVCGYSLAPNTTPALFHALQLDGKISHVTGSILDTALLEKTFQTFQPEVVFHLAAQPLVRLSYEEPVETYQTNVLGTLHVLEAARKCPSVKAFVNVTSDKCYENNESGRPFVETDPFGGYDPYSSSKGCVEILSASYRRSFLQPNGFALATARAGNVIGGGDWAQDRLLPDCIRAFVAGKTVEIRQPQAVRPWQHVLEPLSGYLLLGYKLYTQGQTFAQGFNFGPHADSCLTVAQVAQEAARLFGRGEVALGPAEKLHEATHLTLSIEKARQQLGWHPIWSVQEALENAVAWYRCFYQQVDVQTLTREQISNYTEKIDYAG